MAELLFILTTIYVAYVVYKVSDDKKAQTHVSAPPSAPTILTPTAMSDAAVEQESISPVHESSEAAEKEDEIKSEEGVETNPVSSNNLRDPDSGETAKVSNNYRSLKRWLKEALVKEGFLEKVYHNNELNDETNAKIKEALEKIKALPKYHA